MHVLRIAALALVLTCARAQFIETYAFDIHRGARACACTPSAPCQHIASTIVRDTLGFGTVRCNNDTACTRYNAARNDSLTGAHFFFCCGGGDAPLRTCAAAAAVSTPASAPIVQTVVRETRPAVQTSAPGTTTTTPAPKPEPAVSSAAAVPEVLVDTNATPAVAMLSGRPEKDPVCSVACLAGISSGAAALILLTLLVTLRVRAARKEQLEIVQRDIAELATLQRYPGAEAGAHEQRLYEQIKDEVDYEQPVPVKPPISFFNPLYDGPEVPTGIKMENEQYATPNTGEDTNV